MDPSPSKVLDDRDEFVLDDRDEFVHDNQVLYFQTYEHAQHGIAQLQRTGYSARITQLCTNVWVVEGER